MIGELSRIQRNLGRAAAGTQKARVGDDAARTTAGINLLKWASGPLYSASKGAQWPVWWRARPKHASTAPDKPPLQASHAPTVGRHWPPPALQEAGPLGSAMQQSCPPLARVRTECTVIAEWSLGKAALKQRKQLTIGRTPPVTLGEGWAGGARFTGGASSHEGGNEASSSSLLAGLGRGMEREGGSPRARTASLTARRAPPRRRRSWAPPAAAAAAAAPL